MVKRTVIVEVMHENGIWATAKPTRPNSTLFEVTSGPHAGKRGADSDLFDLCGPIEWDRCKVAIYETGERLTQGEFEARLQARWACPYCGSAATVLLDEPKRRMGCTACHAAWTPGQA